MAKGAHCFEEVNERLCWVYTVLLLVLLSRRCRRCDGSSSWSLGLREIGQNQRKPSVFKASDLCPHYNRRVDSPNDAGCFHICTSSRVSKIQHSYCLQTLGNYANFCIGRNLQHGTEKSVLQQKPPVSFIAGEPAVLVNLYRFRRDFCFACAGRRPFLRS